MTWEAAKFSGGACPPTHLVASAFCAEVLTNVVCPCSALALAVFWLHPCMLSVGTIHFEDRFCTSKKGGIGGGRQAWSQPAVHMAAALASCRMALVGTQPVGTNRHRNHSSPLVGVPSCSFQSGECLLFGEP